jgi:DNA-binding phage protein
MNLETRMRDRFAKRLARFVQKEREQLGCAKKAMKEVAQKLGMSAVNVYRAMNGYGPVTVKMHHHAALIIHTVLAKAPKATAQKARVKQAFGHIRGRLAEARA